MRKPRTRGEMLFFILSILIVLSMVLGSVALPFMMD